MTFYEAKDGHLGWRQRFAAYLETRRRRTLVLDACQSTVER